MKEAKASSSPSRSDTRGGPTETYGFQRADISKLGVGTIADITTASTTSAADEMLGRTQGDNDGGHGGHSSTTTKMKTTPAVPTVDMLQTLSTDDPELMYKTFQEVLAGLREEIGHLSKMEDGSNSGSPARKAANDELLGKISALSNWVVDVGPKLSTRDQEGYSNHVRTLQTSLRAATNPKKSRFKFKSRLPPPDSTTGTAGSSPGSSPLIPALVNRKDTRHLHFSLPNAIDSDSDVLPSDRPPAPTSVSREALAPDSHSVIADEVGKTLDLPSYPGRPVTLTGLHDCVVRNMSDTKIPVLYIKQVRGCVVDGGWVSGSVFLQDVAECAIFVRGRQVRVHETKNTSLVIDVRSQPIVEDCEGVKFFELDREWLEERYSREDDQDAGVVNKWDEVLDFKWHKDGPSPNWTAVRKDEQKGDGLGREQLQRYLRTDYSRLDILRAVGVEVRRGSMSSVALPPEIVVDEA